MAIREEDVPRLVARLLDQMESLPSGTTVGEVLQFQAAAGDSEGNEMIAILEGYNASFLATTIVRPEAEKGTETAKPTAKPKC